ncbi:DUF1015 domain-containing protein [Planctomicrobium sp. SH668]|uniref:DUF1015 domain-containing protein n=1 Tax=Planctomicrobium sp. SH668 TaxID=3448126 RepID=UPI003F5C61BC
MPTLRPVHRALVPVSSDAAYQVSAPNYDEFQTDLEVWDLIQERPENVLKITMPHCHVPNSADILEDGCADALAHATSEMQLFKASPLMKVVEEALWVYAITSPKRPQEPQLGVGGFGLTSEIRTDKTPHGTVVRNEGIRPEKAEGRAQLLRATDADFGTVNLAVNDKDGHLLTALTEVTGSRPCDFETLDEDKNLHRSWIVTDAATKDRLIKLIGDEPAAYVADGNHRSAAAAAMGLDHFLTVFFPTSRLGLEPYNRLLPLNGLSAAQFLEKLNAQFYVESLGKIPPYRPENVHKFGLYLAGEWYELTPKAGSYNPENAAESIDSDIIQRHIIDAILGMADARDKRINYVGGNKDAAYLVKRVDEGDYDFALSLAPVTMPQFVDVCEQNLFMPPKSTWFDPKIRSGLMIALLK